MTTTNETREPAGSSGLALTLLQEKTLSYPDGFMNNDN